MIDNHSALELPSGFYWEPGRSSERRLECTWKFESVLINRNLAKNLRPAAKTEPKLSDMGQGWRHTRVLLSRVFVGATAFEENLAFWISSNSEHLHLLVFTLLELTLCMYTPYYFDCFGHQELEKIAQNWRGSLMELERDGTYGMWLIIPLKLFQVLEHLRC